jgi:hypothetical protein
MKNLQMLDKKERELLLLQLKKNQLKFKNQSDSIIKLNLNELFSFLIQETFNE